MFFIQLTKIATVTLIGRILAFNMEEEKKINKNEKKL